MKKVLLFILLLLSTTQLSAQDDFNLGIFLVNMSNVVSKPKRQAINYLESIGFVRVKKNLFYVTTEKGEQSFILFEKDIVIIKTQENVVKLMVDHCLENMEFEDDGVTDDNCQYYKYYYGVDENRFILEFQLCEDYDYMGITLVR